MFFIALSAQLPILCIVDLHKISMLNQVLLQVFSIGIHGFPRNFAHFVYTDIRQKRHKLRS